MRPEIWGRNYPPTTAADIKLGITIRQPHGYY